MINSNGFYLATFKESWLPTSSSMTIHHFTAVQAQAGIHFEVAKSLWTTKALFLHIHWVFVGNIRQSIYLQAYSRWFFIKR